MKDYNLKPPEKVEPFAYLNKMDDAALLALRHQVDIRLRVQIKDINLTEELNLQYRQGKALLNEVQNDAGTPANQKAQVFNAVKAMLADIIKQIDIVNSAERLKRFEVAFLKTLEQMPVESKTIFFDLYGEYLKEQSV